LTEGGRVAIEIERKFLVDRDAWRPEGPGIPIRQGFLSTDKERVVRVRLAGDRAFLTIKGSTENLGRLELEYPIPPADAAVMLDRLCPRPLIEKTRYRHPVGRHVFEVDVFHGDNDGLVVAEVELSAATEPFERPPWLGPEVSSDPRYFNANLAIRPYRSWGDG
jgi:CYTH domain-containing protein